MARILLTGGKSENVSEQKAKKILEWKADTLIDQSRLVDIGRDYFIELKQIKGVTFDNAVDPDTEASLARDKISQEMKEFRIYCDQLRIQAPEKKARRMIESWVWLLWCSRGNEISHKDTFLEGNEELETSLMVALLEHFEQNPTDYHAPREVYETLIPYGEKKINSKIEGVLSMSEAMTGK